MKRDDILVSDHAIERANEIGIDKEKLKDLLLSSIKMSISSARELYKIDKYGFNKQKNIYYFLKTGSSRYTKLLFTVKRYDKRDGGDLWLVITVTKK